MTRFELYDTNGQGRLVDAELKPDEMRILISMFRTHCAVERKAYEFNHFMNWLKKDGVDIRYAETSRPVRVDM